MASERASGPFGLMFSRALEPRMRWGGRGAVSSCAVEKPHFGGWTPLLECEFDLAYSPLMQLAYGKGLLVFCGLDLEDHSKLDPAAKQALAQVVQYARDTAIEPRRATTFIGNAADEDLLKKSDGSPCRQIVGGPLRRRGGNPGGAG